MKMKCMNMSLAVAVLVGCGGQTQGRADSAWMPEDQSDGSSGKGDTTTDAGSDTEGGDGGDTASTTGAEPDADGDSTTGASSTGAATTGEVAQMCDVVGVEGDCADVASCGEGSTAFSAICGGEPREQCCVPVEPPCSVDGAPGLCMNVADCGPGFVTTPGLCPGDSSIQCCTDPNTACDPDAMPLPNEGLEEAMWDSACPDGMVRSAGFCIDKFEASLVELDVSGESIGSWSPYHNPGSARVRAVSIESAVPQGYISQVQAAEACAEAGKRLCTDAEWQRACQGSAGSTYPYGNGRQPGRCNDARDRHPVIEYYGTTAEWIWSEMGNACISQIPESLDLTGENEGCESEDGVVDMMGNVHEWTSNPGGVFRGGFYVDTTNNGEGCLYDTEAHNPSHWDYSTGFRCCAD